MNRIVKLQNTIQPYAWGSQSALADFLGQPAQSNNPQAELWMGAHPKAPSKIYFQGRWQSLDEVISDYPEDILGHEVISRFGPQLPYLFKVLAADQPLSIQAHPSRSQAAAGFARENQEGIALTDGRRNYKDDQHKPECVCAITPFWGVCGFRPVSQSWPLLQAVWPDSAIPDLATADPSSRSDADADRIRAFFQSLMTMDPGPRKDLISGIVSAVADKRNRHAAFEWVLRLNERYPLDVGVICPLLLNLFCLQPGQALFLPAGQLHAYFSGMAIEIMANSDNVLRGGLTPKHVDGPELLNILDFKPLELKILEAIPISPTELQYPSEADEFVLSVLRTNGTDTHTSLDEIRSPHVLLCAHGQGYISSSMQNKEISLVKGESVLVPAGTGRYAVSGKALFYKAAVNLDTGTSASAARVPAGAGENG
jgi:mannose-6-phosphate isomerase